MFIVEVQNPKFLKQQLDQAYASVKQNTDLELCILLSSSKEKELFTITALDSRTHELKLKVLDTNIVDSGECLINAEIFTKMIKTLPDDKPIQLLVDEDEAVLKIQSLYTKIDLPLFSEETSAFPLTDLSVFSLKTVIDGARFCEVIKKTRELSNKDEFLTIVSSSEYFKVYTSLMQRMFSRTIFNPIESIENWQLSFPILLISKLPSSFIGNIEISIDKNCDQIYFSSGSEHLIIKRIATDMISYTVDQTLKVAAKNYWIVESTDLLSDLQRASFLDEKQGIRLEKYNNFLKASSNLSKANSRSTHLLVDSSENFEIMNIDPFLLHRAMKALDAVYVVGLQIEEVKPAFLPGDKEEKFYNLVITDRDMPDFRSIMLTTLRV